MNNRRKWNSKQKAMIVISGLKGQSVSEICREHGISQSQYYKWRDQFLANINLAFEAHQVSNKEQRLLSENAKLKSVIGDLTLELKKSDYL